MIAKIEEVKIADKDVSDDPVLEKQKNTALQNGHDGEIVATS